jgi:branched-chain amino acid aminotransferase
MSDLHANSIVNINGKISKAADAKISVFDRGFLFGDSAYEVIRTYEGIPLLLHEHLKRLWHSAAKMEMSIRFSEEQIIKEVNSTLGELGVQSAYVRIMITRGESPPFLDPTLSGPNNLVIIAREFKENPKSWYEKGVNVIISDIERTSVKAFDPNIKSGNYLNNVMAFMNAKKEGAFEALMLNSMGHLTEGTTSNIWMVKDNKIITPPLSAGLLDGITRKTVLVLAKKNGLIVEQKNLAPDELVNADEAFLTATTKEVVPITRVNNAPIGTGEPGKITLSILKLYRAFIHEQINMS